MRIDGKDFESDQSKNELLSSDPHHDMSGEGCQVRVVRFYLCQRSKTNKWKSMEIQE